MPQSISPYPPTPGYQPKSHSLPSQPPPGLEDTPSQPVPHPCPVPRESVSESLDWAVSAAAASRSRRLPCSSSDLWEGGLRARMARSGCRGVPQHWLPPGDVAGGRRGGADLRQVSDVHEGLVEAVELEGAGQEEKTCREDVGEEPGYGELLQAQVTQPAWREEGQHGLSSIPPQPRLKPPAPGRALVPPQGPHGGQGTLTGYH